MTRQITFTIISLLCSITVYAESWDYIRTSGEYYYGIGRGTTETEADKAAIADMSSMIATNVSDDFIQVDDISYTNGNIDHKSRVLNCIKTYSQATLTNTERWVEGKSPNITVKRFMKKSELSRIFDNRIAKARDMLNIADDCAGKLKIDMALQYYYWAYSLLRSVQFPNEVTDENGRIIVNWIPVKIQEILSDINIQYESKDGDYVNMLFTYKDNPVSSIEFSYSDGRAECQSIAKYGRGMLEMVPGYESDVYHLNIEYEYKGQARGDIEMQSVLDVITPKTFREAEFKVVAPRTPTVSLPAKPAIKQDSSTAGNTSSYYSDEPDNTTLQTGIINQIINAVSTGKYTCDTTIFTASGLEMYTKLISYGKARMASVPEFKFYKGIDGRTVARGLQMSFSFTGRIKKTFIEEVSFTFNPENKIENVAFGIGKIAEDGIFCKNAPAWKSDTREIIVEFMENYKTAYSLSRLDYIKNIFDDEAVIIVGNTSRRKRAQSTNNDGRPISLEGKNIITYNRYSKDEYIQRLKKCFDNNEFINLRFVDHDVQWLDKYDDRSIFAINIRQEYCSSTYADNGYLFLLVDITDHKEPLIKIRTWQPNEVDINKLYNAGDFYND